MIKGATEFNFQYAGEGSIEDEIHQKGAQKMSGKELREAIVNKKVFGDYLMGYKFIGNILETGLINGVNNVGTEDLGNWLIDMEKDTLTINWNNGWINTITHAYMVNGQIEFYDVDTGSWRTSFNRIEDL